MMKKMIAVLLAFVMVLGLAACGPDTAPEKKEPSLAGKWELDLDMTQMMEKMMTAQLGSADILPKNVDLHVYMQMDLRADGTYSVGLDTDKTGDSVAKYLTEMSKTMIAYLYDMAEQQGMSKEAFDDAFANQNGCTVEEYVETTLGALDTETLFGEIEVENGYYKAENGTIYMADEQEDLVDTDETMTYILTENELKITGGGDGETAMEELEELGIELPLIFKRK